MMMIMFENGKKNHMKYDDEDGNLKDERVAAGGVHCVLYILCVVYILYMVYMVHVYIYGIWYIWHMYTIYNKIMKMATLKTSGLQPVAHLTMAYMSQAALLLELWAGVALMMIIIIMVVIFMIFYDFGDFDDFYDFR